MNTAPKIETLSPAKLELLKLEALGEYVFHGTDAETDELQPNVAIDNKTGPDGDPAIFGSTVAETAIFYAIMKAKNFKHGSVSSKEGSHADSDIKTTTSHYAVLKEDYEQMRDDASGYVYIFNKKDFTPRGEMATEHLRQDPVRPLRRIEVTRADLPKNIELLDSNA